MPQHVHYIFYFAMINVHKYLNILSNKVDISYILCIGWLHFLLQLGHSKITSHILVVFLTPLLLCHMFDYPPLKITSHSSWPPWPPILLI